MLAELYAYRELVRNLVLRDLKLKYRDSLLGFLWSLLNPLMLLAVYSVVFRHIFRVPLENFTLYLLVGILPWTFFAGSVQSSTGSVISAGGLIRKVYFPREIIPISTVLFLYVQFLLAMSVVLPVMLLAFGGTLSWPALLFLPITLMHLGFTVGVAFALSAITTTFRDVAHFTEIAIMILFWLNPIVYRASDAPPLLQRLFDLNPLSAFTLAYQDVLFWNQVPSAAVVASLILWTVAAVWLGHAVFRSYEPRFAETV